MHLLHQSGVYLQFPYLQRSDARHGRQLHSYFLDQHKPTLVQKYPGYLASMALSIILLETSPIHYRSDTPGHLSNGIDLYTSDESTQMVCIDIITAYSSSDSCKGGAKSLDADLNELHNWSSSRPFG